MAKPRFKVIIKVGASPTDFIKYRNVTNLDTLQSYLDRKFPDWRFINVYDDKTKEFVECIKKNKGTTKQSFNVIVHCADGKYRKWKTSDCMDFLNLLNEKWTGWYSARFFYADTRKLWRSIHNTSNH